MADSRQTQDSNTRRARYSRSWHRDQNHNVAHDESAPVEPVPNRPLVPRGAPALVATAPAFDELLAHLRAAGAFAYDSEFIGELTYLPKLCLIQVATIERVALIDPLAGLDLSPFWHLLADPTVEKVVHAGDQDIEPIHRNCGHPGANFFDTQVVAGFVGLAYPVSLSKLVQELVGVRLGKGLTFTHWDQRPLSSMQVRYAADDVRYLLAIRAELGERLKANGHGDWARAECDALCDPSRYGFDRNTSYLRVRGAGSLSPPGLAVLRELTVWRDGAARAHDVPPRAFLKDEVLIDLARTPVKSAEKLSRVKGLPRPVEAAHGEEIMAATRRGLETPASDLPAQRHFEPTPAERFAADALWAAAQCLCHGRSIDPALITSRQEVGELHRLIGRGEQTGASPLMQGWRREALGEPLLRFVGGKDEFRIDWAEGGLRTLPASGTKG